MCQVALVTGGAQGLGAAICKLLLDNAYKVCVADIQEEKGRQFVTEQQKIYGAGNVKFVVCDVTKEDDYEKTFKYVIKEFKRLDLVVNNAGILLEQNPRKTIEVNLIGPIIGCQLAMKYMGKSNGGKGGMVINTASFGGFLPCHSAPVYHASKHGVIGLTRSYGLQYHLERDGIVFTAICPRFTDTDLLRHCATNTLIENEDPTKEFAHELMTPEYVAKAVLKLLEDKINGSTLAVTHKGFFYVGYQEEIKEYVSV